MSLGFRVFLEVLELMVEFSLSEFKILLFVLVVVEAIFLVGYFSVEGFGLFGIFLLKTFEVLLSLRGFLVYLALELAKFISELVKVLLGLLRLLVGFLFVFFKAVV